MSDTIHIGFTGTRFGMSEAQRRAVSSTVEAAARAGDIDQPPMVAHHGDCRGADSEFHAICRELRFGIHIVVHPGPDGDLHRAFCLGDEGLPVMSHMKRDAAIVAASHIMIAAPYENEPQPRGGTWATIGMARKALKRGTLRALYVVGREGQLLEHEGWKLWR